MHVAIAVGTLLLGGWVLNSSVSEDESVATRQGQPPATVPGRQPGMDRDEGRMMQGAGGERMRGRSTSGGQQGRMQRQSGGGMPLAPTDFVPPGAEGMLGQPAAPTATGSSGDASRGGAGMNQSFGSRAPIAPTEQRASPLGAGYRPMSHSMSDQNRGAARSAMTAPSVTEKAFAGYRAPSGVSPYMNLFRREGDGVNNYQSLVRPEVEQRYLNQQFGHEIRGLERDTRMQGTNLQQINRQNRTLQGVGTPQFYMNYGNYYQGYGQ